MCEFSSFCATGIDRFSDDRRRAALGGTGELVALLDQSAPIPTPVSFTPQSAPS